MDDSITVEEALYLMPSLTPVKVIFESGCFLSGSKYKILRQLSPQQKYILQFITVLYIIYHYNHYACTYKYTA